VIRLVLHQTRFDLLTFARNRQARFFTVLLPVIFLLIFVSVFGNQLIGPEHIKASTYYVPGIAALAVLTASFSNLVISITTQRELGILKRRRATPAPAGVIIAGRAITSLVVSLSVTAVVIAIGTVVFGVHVSAGALGALALSIALGSLALACLGYAVATVISSADSAQPATLAITLPLGFISGVYIPPPNLPTALRHIAEWFPLQHLVAALGHGFLPGGADVAWSDLAILAAWGLGGLMVALTRFRWTPAAINELRP
jgi:ABC-2 type transport system permease protein